MQRVIKDSCLSIYYGRKLLIIQYVHRMHEKILSELARNFEN